MRYTHETWPDAQRLEPRQLGLFIP
jgi:hypothetical protein